jgi:hypothetical protein
VVYRYKYTVVKIHIYLCLENSKIEETIRETNEGDYILAIATQNPLGSGPRTGRQAGRQAGRQQTGRPDRTTGREKFDASDETRHS